MLLLIWDSHMRPLDMMLHSPKVWLTKLSIYQYNTGQVLNLQPICILMVLSPTAAILFSASQSPFFFFGSIERSGRTHFWSSVYENHVFQWFLISPIVSVRLFIYTPYVHLSITQPGFPLKIDGVIQGYISPSEWTSSEWSYTKNTQWHDGRKGRTSSTSQPPILTPRIGPVPHVKPGARVVRLLNTLSLLPKGPKARTGKAMVDIRNCDIKKAHGESSIMSLVLTGAKRGLYVVFGNLVL